MKIKDKDKLEKKILYGLEDTFNDVKKQFKKDSPSYNVMDDFANVVEKEAHKKHPNMAKAIGDFLIKNPEVIDILEQHGADPQYVKLLRDYLVKVTAEATDPNTLTGMLANAGTNIKKAIDGSIEAAFNVSQNPSTSLIGNYLLGHNVSDQFGKIMQDKNKPKPKGLFDNLIAQMTTFIKTDIPKFITSVGTELSKPDNWTNAITTGVTIAGKILKPVFDSMTYLAQSYLDPAIASMFSGENWFHAFKLIEDTFLKVGEFIGAAVGGAIELMKDPAKTFSGAATAIMNGIKAAADAVKDWSAIGLSILAGIGDWFSTNFPKSSKAVSDMVGGIISAVAKADWSGYATSFLDIAKKFVTGIATGIMKVPDLAGKLLAAIRAGIFGSSGNNNDKSGIKGGVFTGSTGSTQLIDYTETPTDIYGSPIHQGKDGFWRNAKGQIVDQRGRPMDMQDSDPSRIHIPKNMGQPTYHGRVPLSQSPADLIQTAFMTGGGNPAGLAAGNIWGFVADVITKFIKDPTFRNNVLEALKGEFGKFNYQKWAQYVAGSVNDAVTKAIMLSASGTGPATGHVTGSVSPIGTVSRGMGTGIYDPKTIQAALGFDSSGKKINPPTTGQSDQLTQVQTLQKAIQSLTTYGTRNMMALAKASSTAMSGLAKNFGVGTEAIQTQQIAIGSWAKYGGNDFTALAKSSSKNMSGLSKNMEVGTTSIQTQQIAIESLKKYGINNLVALAKASSKQMDGFANNMDVGTKAVQGLQKAINALKSKTVTVSVKVSGASNGITVERIGTGGVISAARGFVTSGPQMLLVGDNPSGRETVAVIPNDNPRPTMQLLDRQIFGESRGYAGNVTVNLTNVLNDREITRSFRKEIGKDIYRFGPR